MFEEKTTPAAEDPPLVLHAELSPEVQRVSSVLENCISQVEIAAALPNILQFYTMSRVVNEDLSKVLEVHQALEERLKKLECQRLTTDKLKEKEEEEAIKREVVQLREGIKNSVRDVLRLLRLHPNALCNLREEINMEVAEKERMLIKTLQTFHSYMNKRFCSEKEPLLVQIQRSYMLDKSLEDLILEEDESAANLKEYDEMISWKDSQIKQLEGHLKERDLQTKNESSVQDQLEQLNLNELGAEQSSLEEKIDQLSMQLNMLMLENRKTERILQEKNDSLKTTTENIVQSFDKEMQELQAKLEQSEERYEKEMEEVRKLEGPFSVLQEQYDVIQERKRLAEEKRKEEMRQLELKSKATIIIQAGWRGYSVRKALKSKAKKTKKSKKGKGKKTK